MFRVSRTLAVGPYPGGESAARLARGGVTHVLNVAEARGRFDPGPFAGAAWVPLEDLRPIPRERAEECLEVIRSWLGHAEPLIYVHCAAGQNRSPTVLWLALIAAGLSPAESGERIARASFDAIPGHPALVGPGLVAWAQAWGADRLDAAQREALRAPAP